MTRRPKSTSRPIEFGDDWDPGTAGDAPHDDRFDAFNATTWHFKPAPTPWYQTRQASSAWSRCRLRW